MTDLLDSHQEEKLPQKEEYEIFLPTQHRCGQRCQYAYIFGFPCGKNPQFVDGKCDKEGQVNEHSSPQVLDCLDEHIWAHLDEKGEFLKHDETVITDEDIKIQFTYPLSQAFDFDFHSDGGFTRKQLTELIAKTYQKIYEEEENTANEYEYQYKPKQKDTDEDEKAHPVSENEDESCDDQKETSTFVGKVIPVEIRAQMGRLLNRNETDGKYGIWGHDIGDLWLEGIYYNPQTKTVTLSIGS